MRKQDLFKQYTCVHLAISVCVTVVIALPLFRLISTDSYFIPVVSELIAVTIVAFTYATPFFRLRLQKAPMTHLAEAEKGLFRLSFIGIALIALSPFVLPHGTMEVGSAINKALSVVAIAAFSVVPISIGIHSLLLLIARCTPGR